MGRAEPWPLGDTGSTRVNHLTWGWESRTNAEIQGWPLNCVSRLNSLPVPGMWDFTWGPFAEATGGAAANRFIGEVGLKNLSELCRILYLWHVSFGLQHPAYLPLHWGTFVQESQV